MDTKTELYNIDMLHQADKFSTFFLLFPSSFKFKKLKLHISDKFSWAFYER